MEVFEFFSGHSSRQLLIFLLLSTSSKKYLLLNLQNQETLTNKVLNYYEGKNLREFNITNNFFKKVYIFLKKNLYLFKLKKYLCSQRKLVKVYGDEINLEFIVKQSQIIVIEDGIGTYTKLDEKINLRKSLYLFYKVLWKVEPIVSLLDERIEKIYLTELASVPEVIKDKVEIINLKKLWEKKSMKEKDEILDIFSFNQDIIEKIKNKKNILYTQPLSEDGFISEVEKIELYSKIIKKYEKDSLVIKVHPREKTDYSIYFKEIEVLSENFPAEIFELLDIKFEKCITIFSTAALSLKGAEIDFYGTHIHPELLKKWGDSDLIMKANVFLDNKGE